MAIRGEFWHPFVLLARTGLARARALPTACLLLICAAPLFGQAQQNPAPKPSAGRSTTSPARPVYASTAFDPTQESLPPSYAGMDCVRALAALKRAKLAKGEFETTAVYETRKAEVLGQLTLHGSIKATDLLAFKVDLKRQYKTAYDADNEALSLSLEPREGETGYLSVLFGRPSGFDMTQYLPVTILSSSNSSYLGSNAFGVKTRVRKESGSVCALLRQEEASMTLLGPSWVDTDVGGLKGEGAIRFKMAGADAQTFIPRLAMLVIGRLDTPYYRTGGLDVHGPTRDEPYDREISVDGLVLSLSAIWYYDPRSGRVFYKQQTIRE